jgi:hypothetical protein
MLRSARLIQLYFWALWLTTTHAQLGALTTVFSPPPSCTTDISYDEGGYLRAGFAWAASSLTLNRACFPQGWTASATFSPGVCPAGKFETSGVNGWTMVIEFRNAEVDFINRVD